MLHHLILFSKGLIIHLIIFSFTYTNKRWKPLTRLINDFMDLNHKTMTQKAKNMHWIESYVIPNKFFWQTLDIIITLISVGRLHINIPEDKSPMQYSMHEINVISLASQKRTIESELKELRFLLAYLNYLASSHNSILKRKKKKKSEDMTLTSSKYETTDSFTMKREGQNSNCCNLILKMINSYYVVVP